jgi:hypothetical protein
MKDLTEEIADILADIEDGVFLGISHKKLHLLLTKAAGRIDRLQRENRDLKSIPSRFKRLFTRQ